MQSNDPHIQSAAALLTLADNQSFERYMRPEEVRQMLEQFVQRHSNESSLLHAHFYTFEVDGLQCKVFYITPKDTTLRQYRPMQINIHPHSNEVVAPLTTKVLLEYVSQNPHTAWQELNVGGIAVYDADPMTTQYNGDTMYSLGPWSVSDYIYDAFRSHLQVDLDFPGGLGDYRFELPRDDLSYPSKMGTMALADFLKPGVYIPGHNLGINDGVLIYTSHKSSRFSEVHHALLGRTGLYVADSIENTHQAYFAPGNYEHFGVRTIKAMMDDYGEVMKGMGLSSTDVMIKISPDTFCVTDETPYFNVKHPSEELRETEAREILACMEELHDCMRDILLPIEEDEEVLRTARHRSFFASAYAPLKRWELYVAGAQQDFEEGELDKSIRMMPFFMGISLGMAYRLHKMLTGRSHVRAQKAIAAAARRYQQATFISHAVTVKSQLSSWLAAIMAAKGEDGGRDYEPADVSDLTVTVPKYKMPREFEELIYAR